MTTYNDSFFKEQKQRSRRAAELVLPELLSLITVKSVVDFGCGIGTWLSVFKTLGVDRIKGLDGFGGRTSQLQIDRDQFQEADLSKPIDLGQTYDLAMSLEVAEHLPFESSELFVETLCRHSDMILFSAAIPRQDGVGHINEQWQEFWAELFVDRGYVPCLGIRERIWSQDGIPSYYKQNMILYVKQQRLDDHSQLKPTSARLTSVVHPELFTEKADMNQVDISKFGLRRVITGLPRLAFNSVWGRLRGK